MNTQSTFLIQASFTQKYTHRTFLYPNTLFLSIATAQKLFISKRDWKFSQIQQLISSRISFADKTQTAQQTDGLTPAHLQLPSTLIPSYCCLGIRLTRSFASITSSHLNWTWLLARRPPWSFTSFRWSIHILSSNLTGPRAACQLKVSSFRSPLQYARIHFVSNHQ